MVKFLPCRRYHKSSDGKFSHISVVVCRFPYLFKMMQSLSWNIQSFQMGAEKTFSFPWSLPKWEHRRPAFTFFSTLFWLNFFSCGLFLLVPRIASVEFSSAALAHPPGLEPALLQPVAEEGAWSSGCVYGLKDWGEGAGKQEDHECPTWGRLLNVPPIFLKGPMDASVILLFFSPLLSYCFITSSEDIQVSSHDQNRIFPLLQEALLTSFFGLHRDMFLGSVNPML